MLQKNNLKLRTTIILIGIPFIFIGIGKLVYAKINIKGDWGSKNGENLPTISSLETTKNNHNSEEFSSIDKPKEATNISNNNQNNNAIK